MEVVEESARVEAAVEEEGRCLSKTGRHGSGQTKMQVWDVPCGLGGSARQGEGMLSSMGEPG